MSPGPVRLLVDGRSFADASSFRGIGTYVREVVSGLVLLPDFHVSVLAVRAAELPAGAHLVGVRRFAPGRMADKEHELLLPLDLLRRRHDVVLSPAMDPPALSRRPLLQTIQDLLPLTEGTAADVRRWERQAPRYRRAAGVVTGSQWTADESIRLLGLRPERVHVIPHGVADRFVPGRRDDQDPYLLFVGEYDPRKRHAEAFAAVAALADRGLPHRLIVTGRIAPWFEERINALIRESPRPDLVTLVGHVTAERLLELYQGADALVITSRGEGFGFPAVEAMACGTPVVAFSNSATTEVVASGGTLVADGEVREMVSALEALLGDRSRWGQMSEAATRRARAFRWDASVAAHAQLLRSLAAEA